MLRTFTAADGCGNSATYVQSIEFNDTTAPVIPQQPSRRQLSRCQQERSIPVEYPEAEDACGTVSIAFVDVCTEQGVGGYTATRTFTVSGRLWK